MERRRLLLVSVALGAMKLGIFLATLARLASEHLGYSFCTWDCVRYEDIARRGYVDPTALGLFPILPLVGGGLSRALGVPFAPLVVGLHLALYPLLVALFIRWCERIGLRHAWLPALIFTCDRYTLWSHIPYTEMFFVLGLLAFLLDVRSRGIADLRPALIAGATSGVRMVGFALVGGLGLGHLRGFLRRPFWGVVTLVIGLGGLICFFAYLQAFHGSWRAGIDSTQAGWGREFSFAGFFTSAKLLLVRFYFPTVPVTTAGLWLLIAPPRRLTLTLTERWVFFLLFFVPMAQTVQTSITRYLTMLLPGYVGLAYAWERARERWKSPWLVWVAIATLAAEVVWQVVLTRKFYLGEVFFWAA